MSTVIVVGMSVYHYAFTLTHHQFLTGGGLAGLSGLSPGSTLLLSPHASLIHSMPHYP